MAVDSGTLSAQPLLPTGCTAYDALPARRSFALSLRCAAAPFTGEVMQNTDVARLRSEAADRLQRHVRGNFLNTPTAPCPYLPPTVRGVVCAAWCDHSNSASQMVSEEYLESCVRPLPHIQARILSEEEHLKKSAHFRKQDLLPGPGRARGRADDSLLPRPDRPRPTEAQVREANHARWDELYEKYKKSDGSCSKTAKMVADPHFAALHIQPPLNTINPHVASCLPLVPELVVSLAFCQPSYDGDPVSMWDMFNRSSSACPSLGCNLRRRGCNWPQPSVPAPRSHRVPAKPHRWRRHRHPRRPTRRQPTPRSFS